MVGGRGTHVRLTGLLHAAMGEGRFCEGAIIRAKEERGTLAQQHLPSSLERHNPRRTIKFSTTFMYFRGRRLVGSPLSTGPDPSLGRDWPAGSNTIWVVGLRKEERVGVVCLGECVRTHLGKFSLP